MTLVRARVFKSKSASPGHVAARPSEQVALSKSVVHVDAGMFFGHGLSQDKL